MAVDLRRRHGLAKRVLSRRAGRRHQVLRIAPRPHDADAPSDLRPVQSAGHSKQQRRHHHHEPEIRRRRPRPSNRRRLCRSRDAWRRRTYGRVPHARRGGEPGCSDREARWDRILLERIEEASQLGRLAEVGAVICGEGTNLHTRSCYCDSIGTPFKRYDKTDIFPSFHGCR